MRTFKQNVLQEAFTRQHYEAVAKLIQTLGKKYDGDEGAEAVLHDVAVSLAAIFAEDNSRFDKGFFLTKCGV
jgi:hypothetical protein